MPRGASRGQLWFHVLAHCRGGGGAKPGPRCGKTCVCIQVTDCGTKWGQAVHWPRHAETECCTPSLSPLITITLKAAPALDNSPASSYPTPGLLFHSEDLACYLTENIGTVRLAYSQISLVKDHMAPLRSGARGAAAGTDPAGVVVGNVCSLELARSCLRAALCLLSPLEGPGFGGSLGTTLGWPGNRVILDSFLQQTEAAPDSSQGMLYCFFSVYEQKVKPLKKIPHKLLRL